MYESVSVASLATLYVHSRDCIMMMTSLCVYKTKSPLLMIHVASIRLINGTGSYCNMTVLHGPTCYCLQLYVIVIRHERSPCNN